MYFLSVSSHIALSSLRFFILLLVLGICIGYAFPYRSTREKCESKKKEMYVFLHNSVVIFHKRLFVIEYRYATKSLLDSTSGEAKFAPDRPRRVFYSPSFQTSGPRPTMSNSLHSNNFRRIDVVDSGRDDLRCTNSSNLNAISGRVELNFENLKQKEKS